MKPIGICNTCFDEKFIIPRQPGLAPSTKGILKLYPPFNKEEALKGLEEFSHIFIFWQPHKVSESNKLTVRPPRLGGNKRMGVFATRSPFRPNPICHSVVELEKIEKGVIYFRNHDILDETPVYDIKPYIPEWDIFPEANSGWVGNKITKTNVHFELDSIIDEELKLMLTELLCLYPQPSYQVEKIRDYAFKISNHEIKVTYDPDLGFIVRKTISLL